MGQKSILAKVEDIDDATCFELRLIENTHREDLTDAEKGDAVYGLIGAYPEKYPSIASVAEAINKSYNTVWVWGLILTHARKLAFTSPARRGLFKKLNKVFKCVCIKSLVDIV